MRDIARKTTWAYAGTNFDTELEAIDANLKVIGGRLVRLHANNPLEGLISYGDEIAPLLIRRSELRVMEELPADRLEGTRSDEPEGTRERQQRELREWYELTNPLDDNHQIVVLSQRQGYESVLAMFEHAPHSIMDEAYTIMFRLRTQA